MITGYTITDIQGPLEIRVENDEIKVRSATGEVASADFNGILFQTTSTLWVEI